MLTIVATHPIQYQAPIWRELARRERVPFEVVYLCDHGQRESLDAEFGQSFSWDVDLLDGYPSHMLSRGGSPAGFWSLRATRRLWSRLRETRARVVLLLGWQVAGYWEAAAFARASGAQIWLRGETNLRSGGRGRIATMARRALFSQVARFFCIGKANRAYFLAQGIEPERLLRAPYCVDNDRFAAAARDNAQRRDALRDGWAIPREAYCFVFVGKLIAKKRPRDILEAAAILHERAPHRPIHLLWVGDGALGQELRDTTRVVFDAKGLTASGSAGCVASSFAGFLNQSQIAEAYCAADCLILPSGPDETWGLVVNEAMASGRPAIVSAACGCADDLVAPAHEEMIYPEGDVDALARGMEAVMTRPPSPEAIARTIAACHLDKTVDAIEAAYCAAIGAGAVGSRV